MPKVKRLAKLIHPNSRKAMELASKEYHKARNAKSHQETKNKFHALSRKLQWFKEALASLETKPFYSIDDTHSLIELYFHRFDDEVEQIQVKNSIGKRQKSGQHFSRQNAIHITLEQEKNEYETSGLIVPDLTNAENVEILRKWNGETHLLQTIRVKPIKKRDRKSVV